MSVMLPKTRWLLIGAVLFALVTILAFLYVKRQAYDDTAYFEGRALLGRLKQMDMQWELDLLKAKAGVDTSQALSADPLVTLLEFAERTARLTKGEASETALEAARKAIRDKSELVTLVRSRYSKLRTSLTLLPSSAVVAQRQLGNAAAFKSVDRGQTRNAADDVNRVLVQTFLYTQTPSSERAGMIQSELAKVAGARPALPGEAVEALDSFAGHVKTVVHEEVAIAELLARIAAVPTGATIDVLDKRLKERHETAVAEQRESRTYFSGVSLLVIVLLAYAAFHGVRSHLSTKRLNRTLAEANEGLMQQVATPTPAHPAASSPPEPPTAKSLPEAAGPAVAQVPVLEQTVTGVAPEINTRVRFVKGNLEIVARRMGDIADIEDLCREVVEILSAQGARTMDLQTRLRRVYDVAHKIAGFKVSAELAHRLHDGIRGVNQLSEALVPTREMPEPAVTRELQVAVEAV